MINKNIIFITCDQLAAAMIGCYGGRVKSMPTIDKMAKQGVLFSRNYANTPVCAPNRATFLTGRSPEIHGIINNNYVLSTDMPTYAHVIKTKGYRVGGFGKFHQTPMDLETPNDLRYLGFDESVNSDDIKWGVWLDWIRENHPYELDNALAVCWGYGLRDIKEETKERYEECKDRILKPLKENSMWNKMYTSPLDKDAHDTVFITDKSIDFIDRHIQSNRDNPFFCHISYVDPHDPYDPPKPYDTMYDAEDMDDLIPKSWDENTYKTLADSQNWLGFNKIADNKLAIKKLHAMYHGSLTFLDDQIKRVIDYLEDKDILDDTVVIFSTDHGEMLGEHSLITKGTPYDKSIRTPLIIYGGGVVHAQIDELSCSLDIFPTICDFAGVDKSDMPPVEGKSVMSYCYGRQNDDKWREVSIKIFDMISIITADNWRLTRYNSEEKGQMFDLNNDPDELDNLYYTKEFTDKKLQLLEDLSRAIYAPTTVPNYRNMPLYNGKKYPMNPHRGGLRDGITPFDHIGEPPYL